MNTKITIWQSKRGPLLIDKMGVEHMQNCLRYFARKGYSVNKDLFTLTMKELRNEIRKLQKERDRQKWITENCDATESDIY